MAISQHGFDIAFIDDRRQSCDRRIRSRKSEFPLVDSDGRYTKADRRNAPDRRLANIKVNEIAVNKHIFNSLFSK